jgi:uncharacterized protein (TIGR02588 family)
MKVTLPSRVIIAIALCIILIGVGYVGFTQFFNSNKKNALQIISMELIQSEGDTNFTVTVTIQNTGMNDINNAELNFIFIKDNDIVDSEKQSVQLQTTMEGTYSALFKDVPFETNSTYKTIATIYLDNMLLDTKTITKQF